MIIQSGNARIYVEPAFRTGRRAEEAEKAEKAEKKLAAILAAASYMSRAGFSARSANEKTSDPTPEEMLAIGLSLGLYEAGRQKTSTPNAPHAPKMSAWKMAARLGI